MDDMKPIDKAAVIGCGSVGTAWAALFLAAGLDVAIYDPVLTDGAPPAALMGVWSVLSEMGTAPNSELPVHRLTMARSIEQAAVSASFIQENGPEDLAIKSELLSRISHAAPSDALIASSTGGILPSQLEQAVVRPERFLIGHPFNPAYIVPLVEIVGGPKTSRDTILAAERFYRNLGKSPVILKRESVGHLANRLQAALVREALHLVISGTASAAAVDAAVRDGLGARWAVMGPLMTLHLAGGERGIRHTLDLAAAAYETWWDDLGDDLRLTPDVQARAIEALEDMAAVRTTAEWIGWRDAVLPSVVTDLTKARAGL